MSTLITENLQDSGGSVPVATVRQGSAKAWLHSRVTAGVPALNRSFGISSITDVATGRLGYAFTSAMTDANNAVFGQTQRTVSNAGSVGPVNLTASGGEIANYESTSLTDPLWYSGATFGDLA